MESYPYVHPAIHSNRCDMRCLPLIFVRPRSHEGRVRGWVQGGAAGRRIVRGFQS